MVRKKRLVQFELLRVTAMVMIVAMHYMDRVEGWLPELSLPLSFQSLLGTFLESFCVVAVNIYLLLTGYFMEEGGYRVSRLLKLMCQIWFYALVIPLLLIPSGIITVGKQDGIYGYLNYLMPLHSEHYWFATAYMVLQILSPLLLAGIRNMTKKQMEIALGGLLIFYCGIKSISPFVFPFDRFGYDGGWFVCVALTGAYLKRYPPAWFGVRKKGMALYLACSLVTAGITLLSWGIHWVSGELAYYFTVPFHYNYVFNILGAVGLFGAFRSTEITGRLALSLWTRLGALSFGVYLFHEHIDLRYVIYDLSISAYGNMMNFGIAGRILHMVITVALIFLAGIFLDLIRSVLFRLAGKGITGTRCCRMIGKLDGYFMKQDK